jgi:hypothetical protein
MEMWHLNKTSWLLGMQLFPHKTFTIYVFLLGHISAKCWIKTTVYFLKKSLGINFYILAGKLITIVPKKFKNLISIKNNISQISTSAPWTR